jgi:hypothetical protein
MNEFVFKKVYWKPKLSLGFVSGVEIRRELQCSVALWVNIE